MFLKPVSDEELVKLCSSLDGTKASGYDDISPKVIKECIHSIVEPLCFIFNKSLLTGVVPDKLKISKVIPIFKKNDCKNVENYRPISLLSIFAKLLEKVMHSRLYYFLDKHHILIDEQFGFRPKYSTSLGVFSLTHYISQQLDNGKYCIGLFMDLSKAFDTIDHHILLNKLQSYGIRGLPLKWFESYLLNRK